ncbi:RNA-directed DNA polymerase, eukaryota, partial [Tanacetum coccineum]
MGTYRSKEDDLAKIATSIYITNFPETISAKELFNSCKIYGHVVDSFIPNKRAKNGKRFGFVRFINVFNVERLVSNLCTVWIDRHKLQANIARFKRNNDNGAYAGGKANVGFRDNNMRANNSGIEKVIKQSIDHNAGLGNSYVRAVKGEEKKGAANEKTQPTMVLDDDCLISRDLSHFLMGRVKEFASLAHLKMTISNEGFTDVKIQYLGEFWVMLEFTSKETMKMMHGLTVEGIPFKLWSSKTFNRIATKWGELLDVDDKEETCYHSKRLCIHTKMVRSISEEFKIIHKGKLYWIRANETAGWVPDFQDAANIMMQDDNYMNLSLNEQNFDISDDDNDVARLVCVSIYVSIRRSNGYQQGGSCVRREYAIPPGFSPKENYDVENMHARGENVNLDDHTDRVGSFRICQNLLIGVVYTPHDIKEKFMLWDYLQCEITRWKGQVIIMRDFNEVRVQYDRYGSVFNARGAQIFNSFISDSGLVEINLGGCHYTWSHKSAKKMSKLDRFLVSENLINNSPNITAISLDRYLSDHRPILLRE